MGYVAYQMEAENFAFIKDQMRSHEVLGTPGFILTDIKNLSVRVAVIGEVKSLHPRDWLNFIAPKHDVCTVSESYVADITPTRQEYDILIVVGRDTRRLQRLIRLYAPALTNKPKIAILVGGMPSERSKLLHSGYDDVFDQRMPVPEAQARILAHHRRYRITSGESSAKDPASFDLSQWCDAPLTAREQEVLSALVQKTPEPVLIYYLQKSLSGKRELASSSVRVLVSNIRSKLKPGVSIRYAGSSYAIETDA